MAELLPAIPASTLVLFRERSGAPELLMVERARAMVFAGGALVFPGGRIDPGDHALAARLGGDVHIIRGPNELTGSDALVNMKTGVATLIASPGGQVAGTIVPNTANATPGKAPAAKSK